MKGKLRPQQEVFLRRLVKFYGYKAKGSYKTIAKKIGNDSNSSLSGLCYVSVRNYLLALKAANILKIENKGKHPQVYRLDKEAVDKIIG
jgi:hypothetical protein